ncbi:hypothetical protein BN2537_16903 [Streptomyces venezuelae]|nr:hypothetical protein BN2537_16903 [Streptomyces venezuelae]
MRVRRRPWVVRITQKITCGSALQVVPVWDVGGAAGASPGSGTPG